MIEDGYIHLMLGLDAARRGYWTAYGGSPGWVFLLGEFADAMHARGIHAEDQREIFVSNPARAFAFAEIA
jgi:predicted metal-dependent phosphotriesterase family hydrolase